MCCCARAMEVLCLCLKAATLVHDLSGIYSQYVQIRQALPVYPCDVVRHEAQKLEGSDSSKSHVSQNYGKLLSHS